MEFVRRKNQYVVLKVCDITPEMFRALEPILQQHSENRAARGKGALECLVIEPDWPEYEPTYQAIEKRVREESGIVSEGSTP